MSSLSAVPALALAIARTADQQKRQHRWRLFQILFALTYAGIVMDVITTAIGTYTSKVPYEQNPLGLYLIDRLGWLGLLWLISAICIVCYASCRTVIWRLSTRWGVVFNVALGLLAAVRWLAVVTAILYIAHSVS